MASKLWDESAYPFPNLVAVLLKFENRQVIWYHTYKGCNHLSMLALKSNKISKRNSWKQNSYSSIHGQVWWGICLTVAKLYMVNCFEEVLTYICFSIISQHWNDADHWNISTWMAMNHLSCIEISWLLVFGQCKELEHQGPLYWHISPRISQLQHGKDWTNMVSPVAPFTNMV